MNKYISLLGIALLLLSGAVSAGTLTLCVGNQPTMVEGYQFQLLNILPAKAGTTATMNILGVASPVTLGVDNSLPHTYTDSATGNKIKLLLTSTQNNDCIYLKVDVETPVKCSDSDGADLYTKGTATGLNFDKTSIIASSDYCTETDGGAQTGKGKYVAEEVCLSDERVATNYYECPSGYSCSDGACVKETKKNDVCYDSDSGYSYYTQGKTYIIGKESEAVADYCADGSTLVEYVCAQGVAGDIVTSAKYVCQKGYECSSGACVKQAEEKTCSDSDGGKDVYIKGTATGTLESGAYAKASDSCSSATQVVEYYCDGNLLKVTNQDGETCPSGYSCAEGACVKKSEDYCKETDGGFDIYVSGYRMTDKKDVAATDYCTKSGKLGETYCDGNKGYTKEVDCPSGYYCSDGACVVKPTEVNTTTTSENLPVTIYVFNSDTEYVKEAYVTMYKSSDGSEVRSFYTDKNGKAYFYSWHFTAGEPVYFLATKGSKTYESSEGKGPTIEYTDGKYCVTKLGVTDCGERYSLGLFELTSSTETNESEKPPLPPVENATVSSYTIVVFPGWNLISVPFESGKLTATDCDTNTLYTLNPVGRSYTKDNLKGKSWFGFQGYWMKSSKQCKLQFEVSAEDGFYTASKLDEATGRFATTLNLAKGWNMIGAPQEGTTFSEIAGTCTLSSGPWRYNSETNSWEKATTLESGKGYFVKVTEDCVLGSAMPPLPPS